MSSARKKKSRSTRALRLFCAGDVIPLRAQHPPFMGGGCEISVGSATRRKVYRPTAELLSVPIQYLRGDASWPTMAHNTLVEEKSPPSLPAYTGYVWYARHSWKEGKCVPRTHVHTRVHTCTTRGLYRIGVQQITLISAKQYSYRLLAGEECGAQGRAYCVFLWEFRLSLFFTCTFIWCKNCTSDLYKSERFIIRDKLRDRILHNFR